MVHNDALKAYCAVPENIHSILPPDRINGNSKGEGDGKSKALKKSMELNWNFWRSGGVGGGCKPNLSVWGMDKLFSGTTHCLRQKKRKAHYNMLKIDKCCIYLHCRCMVYTAL